MIRIMSHFDIAGFSHVSNTQSRKCTSQSSKGGSFVYTQPGIAPMLKMNDLISMHPVPLQISVGVFSISHLLQSETFSANLHFGMEESNTAIFPLFKR